MLNLEIHGVSGAHMLIMFCIFVCSEQTYKVLFHVKTQNENTRMCWIYFNRIHVCV